MWEWLWNWRVGFKESLVKAYYMCLNHLQISSSANVFFGDAYMVAFEQELSKESEYSSFNSSLTIVLLLLRMLYVSRTCLRQNRLAQIISLIFLWCNFCFCNRWALKFWLYNHKNVGCIFILEDCNMNSNIWILTLFEFIFSLKMHILKCSSFHSKLAFIF